MGTYEKGLNRGKIRETNKPNKTKIRIRVSRKILAYADRGLCTQAKSDVHRICPVYACHGYVCTGLFKNPNPKKKTLILTTKHAQNIERTVKLTQTSMHK